MPKVKSEPKPWTRRRVSAVKGILKEWHGDAHFVARGPGGEETEDRLEQLEKERRLVMDCLDEFRATLPK